MNWSALRCILILTYFDTALLQMGCYRWAGKKRVCSFILSKSWEAYYEHIWACNRKQLWFQNVSGQLFWPNTGALDKRFLSHCCGIAFKILQVFCSGPWGLVQSEKSWHGFPFNSVHSMGSGWPLGTAWYRSYLKTSVFFWGGWPGGFKEASLFWQNFCSVSRDMMISLHNIFTLLGQRFRSDSSGVYFVYFVLFPMLCYAYFAYFVCRSCWKVPVSLFLA